MRQAFHQLAAMSRLAMRRQSASGSFSLVTTIHSVMASITTPPCAPPHQKHVGHGPSSDGWNLQEHKEQQEGVEPWPPPRCGCYCHALISMHIRTCVGTRRQSDPRVMAPQATESRTDLRTWGKRHRRAGVP